MSITQSPTTPPISAAPPPVRHRYWFPLGVLLLATCAVATPFVWEALDRDPAPLMQMGMVIESMVVPGAVLLIVLWWLLFSGFRWMTRFAVLLLLALAGTGFWFSVRWKSPNMVHSFYLLPRFAFVWEKGPSDIEAKGDLSPIDLTVGPSDFPRYRGRDADGVAHGPPLALSWTATPPRIVYKYHYPETYAEADGKPVKAGYAGFAVAGNVAITVEQRRDKEAVVCYDRATGRQRWVYEHAGRRNDVMGDGPRATPTIDHGEVFAVGAAGDLVCLDGTTGTKKWAVNILEDAASKNVMWGLAGSPLIVDNLVVVNPGVDPDKNAGRAVCAYDRKTGKRVWAAGDHKTGYSSPRLATLKGVRQILVFDAGGLAGLDPANGKELWRYPWKTENDMNTIQPLVFGDDRVFISSELANGSAMVQVQKEGDHWTATELWKSKKLGAKFANPVAVGVAIYGLHGGMLECLDADTGKLFWKGDRFGAGQLLAAGDKILVVSDKGEVVLIAAEPTAYKELGHLQVLDGNTWNTPALAGMQLFLRNEEERACVELPAPPSDDKAAR